MKILSKVNCVVLCYFGTTNVQSMLNPSLRGKIISTPTSLSKPPCFKDFHLIYWDKSYKPWRHFPHHLFYLVYPQITREFIWIPYGLKLCNITILHCNYLSRSKNFYDCHFIEEKGWKRYLTVQLLNSACSEIG